MSYMYRCIALILCFSFIQTTAPAQVPLSAMSSSPLQAEPVQSFINLLSSVRNATPQSSAAKSNALRLFNELYMTGEDDQKELLGNVVAQFRELLSRKLLLPSVKERRIVLLLEETKHLLTQMREHQNLNKNERPADLPAQFAQELYTAVNPTLSDFIRYSGYTIGAIAYVALSTYFILSFSGLISLLRQTQKGEGTLGLLADETGRLMKASRESTSTLSLSDEIALTLQDLRTAPKEAKTTLAQTLREFAFLLKEGRTNPGEVSLSIEIAHALKALRQKVNLNDPAACKNLTLLQGLIGGINTVMHDDIRSMHEYAEKAAAWLKANPGKTIKDLPEECKMAPGTLRRIVDLLELLNVKAEDMETVLHRGIYGIGYSLQELGIDLEKDRNAYPDGKAPSGTTSRIVSLLEQIGLERAIGVLEWWYSKKKEDDKK